MNEKRSCSNCLKGINISVNDDILCREKGAVSADYVCSKHRYAPKQKYIKESVNKCINCDNFILDDNPEAEYGTGLCRLFCVRKFNGSNKKACSKFTRRKSLEVS